jgi:hypothetical protein
MIEKREILLLVLVISIYILINGLNLLRKSYYYTEEVSSKIIASACSDNYVLSLDKFNCKLSVQYNADTKDYNVDDLSISSDVKYIPGNNIEVYYSKMNPDKATLTKFNRVRISGIILLSLILLIYVLYDYNSV